MKLNIYIVLIAFFCLSSFVAQEQEDKRDVRRGNRDFKKENYREADIDYRKALVKDSTSVAANYNLANTLFRQGDMEQAKKMLERVKEEAPLNEAAADYYFNLGDVAIAMEDWQGAVDALEQSLLINPGDLQAKENYVYAKKKLQDQQNQQQNQDQNQDNDQQNQNGQNNDDKKDQEKKNDDRKKDDKDDQNNNQDQNQNQDQQKQQQPQGQEAKITPQAAQQMLQAIQAKEKETQDKVNKEKAEALKARQKDKNW